MYSRSKGLLVAKSRQRTREKRTKQNRVRAKRIDVLPDDVLLEIFDFYVTASMNLWYGHRMQIEAWQSLVHVCRQWRNVVFRSPRRLNLRLFCAPETLAIEALGVWPALPLIVSGNMALSTSADNIIAALGQNDRVCEVNLDLANWQLEKVLAAMRVSFPELTVLRLSSTEKATSAITDLFLGGSAPRLRHFQLSGHGIPFPGLSNLLLSATHLVYLWLNNIPHSGYISPEVMVDLISVLSSLKTLFLQFESPQSRPDLVSPSLPPPKRSILPALYEIHFKGVTEYLEELLTRIDTPQLNTLTVTFFNQIDYNCPRLAQYTNRTPSLRAPDEARVQFHDSTAEIQLRSRTSQSGIDGLEIVISCKEPDWQLSSVEQICNSSLLPLPTVEDLYIDHFSKLFWKNDAIENTQWLQLLLPFAAMKNIYLSKEFAPGIAASLEELVGDRITEVLLSLQNIFVEGLEPSGPFQENIGRFVTARELSGHPIVISDWNRDQV